MSFLLMAHYKYSPAQANFIAEHILYCNNWNGHAMQVGKPESQVVSKMRLAVHLS